jgi:hypothetical protein
MRQKCVLGRERMTVPERYRFVHIVYDVIQKIPDPTGSVEALLPAARVASITTSQKGVKGLYFETILSYHRLLNHFDPSCMNQNSMRAVNERYQHCSEAIFSHQRILQYYEAKLS